MTQTHHRIEGQQDIREIVASGVAEVVPTLCKSIGVLKGNRREDFPLLEQRQREVEGQLKPKKQEGIF